MKNTSIVTGLIFSVLLVGCSPSAEITNHRFYERILLAGDWFLTHEYEPEFIRYSYYPNQDRYSDDNNDVRKMGAMWSLVEMSKFTGNPAYKELAAKGLEYFRPNIVFDKGFAYVDINQKRKLAYNAFLILTLVELDSLADQKNLLVNLAGGLLEQQQENGEYKTYFYSERNTGTDYYPGEANLALMKLYEHNRNQKYLNAVAASFNYYRDYWRASQSLAFIPWHTQAFYILYQFDANPEYKDFIFEMNDWLITHQRGEDAEEFPGAFTRRAGISTSSYLEGLNDAYALAVQVGDTERAQKYKKAITLASDFLLSLQYTGDQTFGIHVISQKALGGFRQSPGNATLRVDNNQHAIIALIKAVQNGL